MQARNPDKARLAHYVAQRTDSGWTVAFGRTTEDSATFHIAYEVFLNDQDHVTKVAEYPDGKPDTSFFLYSARAIALAKADFGPHSRPYNVYVMTDTGRTWAAYLVPAQMDPDTIPLGGDVRYLLTHDGRSIISKTPLHKTVLMMPQSPEGAVSGFHNHVLIDPPVETDVFYVLRQRPRLPHYIVGKDYIYVINPDGSISNK